MSSLILLGKWYDGIVAYFNGFLVNVVGLVYKFASLALRVFLILANGKLVDSSNYKTLVNNLYIIMGIVMLFALAFALLKMMVNPDDAQKGTATVKKIIINLVTSSIMVALLPTIFAFAYDFQNSVLVRQNTIGRIFGYGESQGVDLAIDEGANQMANGVFTAFFNVDPMACRGGNLEYCQDLVKDEDGISLTQRINEVSKTGQFSIYSNFKDEIGKTIEHNVFLNLLAGGFLVYVAISFCFDMAVRYIKLIFYQIIAPIPIFCRVVPEGKLSSIFNQWVKITVTCYLEVYIRILVFYFSIYLFNSLFGSNGFYQGGFLAGSAYGVGLIVKAFVIMGIVMFMKQAPKLISEITGINSGNMKLGIREKLKEGGAYVAGAAIGSGVSSLAKNASNSIHNYRNKFQRDANGKVVKNANGQKMLKNGKAATFGTRFWGAVGGVASTVAGAASGVVSGGKAGTGAKNEKDMQQAIKSGTEKAVGARAKRASYRAARSSGQGGVKGWFRDTGRVIAGHAKDAFKTGYNFVTDQSIEGLTRESQSMGQIISSYSSFSDGIESLLEKEQSKGGGSVFLGHGFETNAEFTAAYNEFDEAARRKRDIQANFQSGQLRRMELRDADGNIMRYANGNIMYEQTERRVTEQDLRYFEKDYSDARDKARDELMNISFAGENSDTYKVLDAKAQAAMQTGIVNAEKFQTTLVSNAGSQAVQTVMGASGNGSLGKILDKNGHLEVKDLEHDVNGTKIKLKDVTNVFKGQVDNRIAQLNKEEAAKGEKK